MLHGLKQTVGGADAHCSLLLAAERDYAHRARLELPEALGPSNVIGLGGPLNTSQV
jgi:hypothetical protein